MKKVLLSLTLLTGAFSAAHAGLILSDDFNYNDGPIAQTSAGTINPGSTWFANTGSVGGFIEVTNDILIVTSSRSEDMEHTLAGFPYPTNGPTAALYSSYILKCTFLPSSSGSYFSHFSGTNGFQNGPPNISGFRARVFASLTNYPTGGGTPVGIGQFNLGIVNAGVDVNNVSLGNTNYIWPTPLNTNTTYTIVTRYVLATGQSTLWVNPTQETDPSVTDTNVALFEPSNVSPTNGPLSISTYGFRQNSGIGTMMVDNLRLGTSFNDVAGNHQPPTISPIPNQSIPAGGSTGPIPFTVTDAQLPAIQLSVSAASDNLTLVPNGAPYIVTNNADAFGTNRTITITPVAGQQGSANITVSVYDGFNTSSTSFKVTVGAPSIGSISNLVTSLNTTTATVPFTVSDAEGDAVTLSASSSNPTLVAPGDVHLGVATVNVSSNLFITPEAGQNGIAKITISAADAHNTNITSFFVTVTPAALGVVYSEDFAYTAFLFPQALYGATGGSGAPWNHVSGPSYEIQTTNVFVNSGFAYLVGTNNEDLSADFIGDTAYNGTNGYVFYTSFTVDFSFLPSNLGDYFFHLAASSLDMSTFHDKVFSDRTNAAAGAFRLGIANQANLPVGQFQRDLQTNATYAVVTRFNAATGDSTLWVNPINEQSGSVSASDSPGSVTIGAVSLRQPGSAIGDMAIGPMKVGTAFSDVFTAPAAPVLSASQDGLGNLILSWTNSLFGLQSASVVTGPFTDVIPAATSPYTNVISGQQYFRLKY